MDFPTYLLHNKISVTAQLNALIDIKLFEKYTWPIQYVIRHHDWKTIKSKPIHNLGDQYLKKKVNASYQIKHLTRCKMNQTEIWLYLQFSDWIGSNSIWLCWWFQNKKGNGVERDGLRRRCWEGDGGEGREGGVGRDKKNEMYQPKNRRIFPRC